ncbi:IS3 family transposase, partial [Corynebacterium timonense]|uniref:IS3 family transposase n=1 Tax=Corynebacterium timonense TaxID=441500 RepID=UPI0012DDE5AA
MIRFKFIWDHRTEFSVTRMCDVLKVRRSSYYKWKNTQAARRQKVVDDAVLGARIRTVFTDEHGLYGAKRIAAALNDSDSGAHEVVNHKRVARIMKAMGIQGFDEETPRTHHRGRYWPQCLFR